MHPYPHDAEERLGFTRIREELLRLARTVYGREELERLSPLSDVSSVARRLQQAGEMQAVLRGDDPVPFASLDDVRPALEQIVPSGTYADAADLLAVGRTLSVLRRLSVFVGSRKLEIPALWDVAKRIVVLEEVEKQIDSVVGPNGEVRDDASPELQRITRSLGSRQDQLRKALLNALREAVSQGYATEDQPTIRGGRSVIPVRAEARRKVSGFVHDVSSTGQTVYIEPAEVLDLNNEIRELEAEQKREIRRLLMEATVPVREHLADIRSGLQVLARIDAIHAIGVFGNGIDALVPEINENGLLRLVRANNATLMVHFREQKSDRNVVPLSLELGGEARTLVITGPNAGGKSVAMKTVGLLSLMVQSGIPIPAAPGTSLPVLSSLFVDLGDRQSIQEDLSTFTSHLQAIRTMLEQADDRSLVLIDEAGTGTDPAEGGALAQAVLEQLTEQKALTVATTHHGTLKAFAHETDGVVNGSMQFDRESLSPTYVFQPDIPGSSYAFEIADRVGLQQELVERARALVGEGKAALEDLIASFEATTQKAREEREEAARTLRKAEKSRVDYEERIEKLKAERDQLKAEALADASKIVHDANAAVEKTIREIKEAEAERKATKAARSALEQTKEKIERDRSEATRKVRARKPEEKRVPSGPIAKGDQVRLDDGDATGEVLELNGSEVVVSFGSMTSRVEVSRLKKVGGQKDQQVEVRARSNAGKSFARTAASNRLDIRGKRVEEAMYLVTRFLDEAIAAGLSSAEVLHGKGTGALRQAVREQLDARPEITSFESAEWNAGGDGVTLVRFD